LAEDVEAAFVEAAEHDYDRSRAALTVIETAVRDSGDSPTRRAALADRLIALIEGESTPAARQFACRQLAAIGGARQVPALVRLLHDPQSADDARYALEIIPDEAAARALRRAIETTDGSARVGVINSVGERRDSAAVPSLRSLLDHSDDPTAFAAADALGKIGDAAAARAIESAFDSAAESRRPVMGEALMDCADRTLDDGRRDDAVAIYRRLHAEDGPLRLRARSLGGLSRAGAPDAAELIVAALGAEDARLRAAAIRFAREIEGEAATHRFAEALESLEGESRANLIRALGDRGDASAKAAILAELKHEDESIRSAAIAALESVGDASAVGPLLISAASESRSERGAARRALARMRGQDVDRAIFARLLESASVERAALLETVAERRSPGAVEALRAHADDRDPIVRGAAVRGAAALAVADDLPSVIALLSKELTEDDRRFVERSVIRLARDSAGDANDPADLVLADASLIPADATTLSLLRVMGELGGARASAELRAALNRNERGIRFAALEGLARVRPADGAIEQLRAMLKAGGGAGEFRAAALDAYIELLAAPSERSGERTLGLLAEAMTLTDAPEKREAALRTAGGVGDVRAFELLLPYFEDARLGDAARSAAVEIASEVGVAHAEAARDAIERALEGDGGAGLRMRANRALRWIEVYEGHILDWDLAGPFVAAKSGESFETAFAPENPAASDDEVVWRRITSASNNASPWIVNLERIIGGDERAAYLRARVWSPTAQAARLELGSDDGIKAWLDGELVHSNDAARGAAAGDDVVDVSLPAGWSELLVKVVNGGGGWGACARIRAADGSRIEGLRVDPDGR
jgi:HEAT repeat protein